MKKKENLNQKWQVSFSDLLTILLCFFVALIAHGSFEEMKSGTAFAESQVEKNDSVSKVVLLSVEDIASKELVSIASSFKNEVNLDSYTKKEVLLSSCENQEIEQAKANLTKLERQIGDINLGEYKLSFELARADCKEKGLEKQVVAKVNIDLKN